jgi:hypothetical protein
MIAKLAAVILAGSATAAGLLAVRQQRLQAVHDTARAVERTADLDRRFWAVRIDLVARTDPARLERVIAAMRDDLGDFEVLFSDWCDSLPHDVAQEVRLRWLEQRGDERFDPWSSRAAPTGPGAPDADAATTP